MFRILPKKNLKCLEVNQSLYCIQKLEADRLMKQLTQKRLKFEGCWCRLGCRSRDADKGLREREKYSDPNSKSESEFFD